MWWHQFLNQARAWFLEITFVREVSMRVVCVCVCVCVCVRACVRACVRPQAIKIYSCEMKSE